MNPILIGGFLFLTLVPQFWAKWIMRKYSKDLEDMPGNGGQLVRHLKKKYKLQQLQLAETQLGDHFNPLTNTIHLTPANYAGKSLTAVAVAAHEFSHALQHAEGSVLLGLRTRLASFALILNRIFDFLLLFGLALVLVNPLITRVVFACWLLSRALGILIHLITLPVELDASFRKALPILKDYLRAEHVTIVRQILTACAYTYLAASLAAFWAILFILRRRLF